MTKVQAYFLSPSNEIIKVETRHILSLFDTPEIFFPMPTEEELKNYYKDDYEDENKVYNISVTMPQPLNDIQSTVLYYENTSSQIQIIGSTNNNIKAIIPDYIYNALKDANEIFISQKWAGGKLPDEAYKVEKIERDEQSKNMDKVRQYLIVKYIDPKYEENHEKSRTEGEARAELLIGLLKNGWIRVREYSNGQYHFQVGDDTYSLINDMETGEIKGLFKRIKIFLDKLKEEGIDTYRKTIHILSSNGDHVINAIDNFDGNDIINYLNGDTDKVNKIASKYESVDRKEKIGKRYRANPHGGLSLVGAGEPHFSVYETLLKYIDRGYLVENKIFNIILENVEKKLYILRGISGSGKSYLANNIIKKHGEGKIFSTDDKFMVDDKYVFTPEKLGEYHKANRNSVEQAMKDGENIIIVDNTNTQKWEMKPYVELGDKYGYDIEIKETETPWAFDAEELAKRNKHGVPLASIKKMLGRWEKDLTPEDIRNS